MYAIHRGRLGKIVDDTRVCVVILFGDGARAEVAYGTAGLVIDPTDAQVLAARARRTIPRDRALERDVHDHAIRMLNRVARDPALPPEARQD
jgi:hypothetical protein